MRQKYQLHQLIGYLWEGRNDTVCKGIQTGFVSSSPPVAGVGHNFRGVF